jgi:hypothetical protein
MPKLIQEVHEELLKNYITNRVESNGQAKEIKTYVKHKNDSISPVNIMVRPHAGLMKGINLIGILTSPVSEQLFGQKIPVTSIFYVLTNK